MLSREKETLKQQVLDLSEGLPRFRMRSASEQVLVGMDKDDVREEKIKVKNQRIAQLDELMSQLKPKQ